jgi:6-phosphogluconolactonase (cycloisomerase 2 family)
MRFLTRIRLATIKSLVAVVAALALALATMIAPSAALAERPHGDPGAVFVQTNDIYENAILAYARSADGTLTLAGRYPTSGRGGTEVGVPTDPLSSQGSLTFDRRHHLLYAVNPGSDTLSVFAVRGTRLRLLQLIGSGGSFPTSIAIHQSLVYVLNAGGDGTISGYRLNDRRLTAIPRSVRSFGLGNATPPFFLSSPAQIGITDDGAQLLVSMKGNGTVDAFALGADGRPAADPVSTATGPVPFPFVFDARGRVVLVDASGSANTYRVDQDGALIATGSPTASGQNAACWLAEARGYYYVTNTASNTITGYAEAPDGQLALTQADGVSATTDAGPIDLAAAPDGRQLFELNGLAGDLGVYDVASDGTLTRTATVDGLPAFNGSNGMEGIAVS